MLRIYHTTNKALIVDEYMKTYAIEPIEVARQYARGKKHVDRPRESLELALNNVVENRFTRINIKDEGING
ncbi:MULTISPECIES: hypothetical protein [Vagococcus]|uniref:hypothetical protein n=1 Tax=Vagococcus TaxID=2737 RepID=UPI000E53478E|nr:MULTISPECIES: hypothetical protein [Vagococcus]RHH70110.1 hypothetical protein DW196_04930 [Vagococcus sp. AM17-17]